MRRPVLQAGCACSDMRVTTAGGSGHCGAAAGVAGGVVLGVGLEAGCGASARSSAPGLWLRGPQLPLRPSENASTDETKTDGTRRDRMGAV